MSHNLQERIRSEYMEMPGLRLTLAQAQRLCGVDRAACRKVFDALVAEKFLCVKPDGTYARLTDGHHGRLPSAKAEMRVDWRATTYPRATG